MPTLLKRGTSPKYRAVVQVNGVRMEKVFPDDSKTSHRAAIKWEDETREKLKKGLMRTDMVSPTLLEWATDYMDSSKERHAKKTYEEKVAAFKRLIRKFGKNIQVSDVSIADAMEYLRDQNRNRSGHGANRDRKNFAAAWKWGRKYMRGFPRGDNPFREADTFPEQRKPRRVPQEEEFWKVYNALEDQQDKLMLLTFLHLGARKSELFRLRVSDINFSRRTVRLWTSKREGGDTEFDELPITEDLKSALSRWIHSRKTKSDFVFVNLSEHNFGSETYGQPFTARQHFLRRACRKAGVEHFDYHSIRHLTATILYRAGQPVAFIQRVLRHQSPNVTERYLKRMGLDDVREKLSAVMNGRNGKNRDGHAECQSEA